MKEVLFGKVGEVSADAEGDAIGTSVVEVIAAFDDSGHIFFDRFNITFEGREHSGVEDEVLAVVAYNTVNQGSAVVRADFFVMAEGAGGRYFGGDFGGDGDTGSVGSHIDWLRDCVWSE